MIVVARAAALQRARRPRPRHCSPRLMGRLDDAERHLGNARRDRDPDGRPPRDGAQRTRARRDAARSATAATTASARWSCSPTVLGTAREMGARWIVDRALRRPARGAGPRRRRRHHLDRRHGLGARGGAPGHARARRPGRDGGDPVQRHRGLDRAHRAARRRALARAPARAQRDLPRAGLPPRRLRGEEPGRRLHARLPRPLRGARLRDRGPARLRRARAGRLRASRCGSGWACTPAR